MKTIGIDLGGTRIKGVLISADGEILHQIYTPTNDGNDQVWKSAIKNTVSALNKFADDDLIEIGISAPGLPNADNTAINFMPGRLQGLEGFIWQDFLEQPTAVLNDGVAALLAEATYGVAKNKKHVAMLTLGTGVGGALLLNGAPFQGDFCRAGHMGHMVIDYMGAQDVTGMPGSLEECIGNCTIEKRTKGLYTATHEVLNAFTSGDEFATTVWLTSVRQLAAGVASIINIISPELVVIGGGIAEANDLLFIPLREYLNEYEWRPGGHAVPIVKANQGDLAGAVGAACFARSKK
jgi:glucokinase